MQRVAKETNVVDLSSTVSDTTWNHHIGDTSNSDVFKADSSNSGRCSVDAMATCERDVGDIMSEVVGNNIFHKYTRLGGAVPNCGSSTLSTSNEPTLNSGKHSSMRNIVDYDDDDDDDQDKPAETAALISCRTNHENDVLSLDNETGNAHSDELGDCNGIQSSLNESELDCAKTSTEEMVEKQPSVLLNDVHQPPPRGSDSELLVITNHEENVDCSVESSLEGCTQESIIDDTKMQTSNNASAAETSISCESVENTTACMSDALSGRVLTPPDENENSSLVDSTGQDSNHADSNLGDPVNTKVTGVCDVSTDASFPVGTDTADIPDIKSSNESIEQKCMESNNFSGANYANLSTGDSGEQPESAKEGEDIHSSYVKAQGDQPEDECKNVQVDNNDKSDEIKCELDSENERSESNITAIVEASAQQNVLGCAEHVDIVQGSDLVVSPECLAKMNECQTEGVDTPYMSVGAPLNANSVDADLQQSSSLHVDQDLMECKNSEVLSCKENEQSSLSTEKDLITESCFSSDTIPEDTLQVMHSKCNYSSNSESYNNRLSQTAPNQTSTCSSNDLKTSFCDISQSEADSLNSEKCFEAESCNLLPCQNEDDNHGLVNKTDENQVVERSKSTSVFLSNLDLILQSVAHPPSPAVPDCTLKSDVLVPGLSEPDSKHSAMSLLENFAASNGMALPVPPVVKRKRGRPKLIREPVQIGPDGKPVATQIKQKRKYVRKKPRNNENSDDSNALDLTLSFKKSEIVSENGGVSAPEMQENLVPIPSKRKYTKKAKVCSTPEKSSILFDSFLSQTVGSAPNCSFSSMRSSSPSHTPYAMHSWNTKTDCTDENIFAAKDSFGAKDEFSANDSFDMMESNDSYDEQKNSSSETPDRTALSFPGASASVVAILHAFENLKETVQLDGERFFRCPACTYMAKQKGNLRRHLQQHNIFQCSHCNFCTGTNPSLDNHMKDAHPSRWGRRKCSKCSKFVRPEDQDDHLTVCTGDKSEWPCDRCSKVFNFEGALKVHMKMHSEEQPEKLVCGCCGKQYKYEAAMRSHLMSHGTESLIFVCLRCGKKCSDDSDLQNHIKQKHVPKDAVTKSSNVDTSLTTGAEGIRRSLSSDSADYYQMERTQMERTEKLPDLRAESLTIESDLPQSSEKFENASNAPLPAETKPLAKAAQFSCGECVYETPFKSSLAKHMAMQHAQEKGEKTIKCPQCEKLFNTECGMQKHLKILHSDERSFICPVCSKAFKTPNSLTLHSEVHNSDETYACNIDGCTKSFRAKRMLTNHKKVEHGILVKRFDCLQPGCRQVFLKESHLRKHLATSHAGETIVDNLMLRKKFFVQGDLSQISKMNERKCRRCQASFDDEMQLSLHAKQCAIEDQDDDNQEGNDSNSDDTIIDVRFTESRKQQDSGGLKAVYDFVEFMGDSHSKAGNAKMASPESVSPSVDGVVKVEMKPAEEPRKKRGRKPKDKNLIAGTSENNVGINGEIVAKKKRGRKKKVLSTDSADSTVLTLQQQEEFVSGAASSDCGQITTGRDHLLSAGILTGRSSTDSQLTVNRNETKTAADRISSSLSSHDEEEDMLDSEFPDLHSNSDMPAKDRQLPTNELVVSMQVQQQPQPAPSIFDDAMPILSSHSQHQQLSSSSTIVGDYELENSFELHPSSMKNGGEDNSVFRSHCDTSRIASRNVMMSPEKVGSICNETANSYASERGYVGEMECDNYLPGTPSMESHQQSPSLRQQQHQQQRASSVISHTSQQMASNESYGGGFGGGGMMTEDHSPMSTTASGLYSVNSPATYSSPAFLSSLGGFGAPSAMTSMLSSYGPGSSHYGVSSNAGRSDESHRSAADPLFQPGGLGFGSTLPSSSSYGGDSFANRDFFNPYLGEPSLSLGSHGQSSFSSVQDQRALSYMQSLQQQQRGSGTDRSSMTPGSSSYPMATSDAFSSITPSLPLQQQHWMGTAERPRPWGRSSPTLVNPIATGGSYSEYGFDAGVGGKRGGESGFTPSTAYGLPSSYVAAAAAGRSALGQATDGSYGRTGMQKTFEDAYQQMANSYRSLSQAPATVSDMYGRIGMTPFDKYYYSGSDPLYRSQQLTAGAGSNPMFLNQPQMMYGDREYMRNPMASYATAQPSATSPYGFGGKLGTSSAADYLQSRPAPAPIDPHMQDPYQRSVLYNMMSRYYQ